MTGSQQGISLVISLHDWFTTGAMAADENCITRSEVVSRKVLNDLKQKTSLWRALSKRPTVKIFLPQSFYKVKVHEKYRSVAAPVSYYFCILVAAVITS